MPKGPSAQIMGVEVSEAPSSEWVWYLKHSYLGTWVFGDGFLRPQCKAQLFVGNTRDLHQYPGQQEKVKPYSLQTGGVGGASFA